MKSALFATALFVVAASAQFQVNTPANVVECQPLQIVWNGGSGSTFLHMLTYVTHVIHIRPQSVLPGSDPTGTAIIDFGQQTSPFTWPAVNVTAGTSLGLTVRDSTGALAQSAAFTVNGGSDTSCLTGGGSSSSASAASSASGSSSSSSAASSLSASSASASTSSSAAASSSSSASSASSAATGASTTASRTTGASSSSGSSTATSAASSSSSGSSSAAGPTLAAQYGAAGVFGALAAAVLL
ncbi:uncharacterized protein STEHIDRAFT_165625 [Stereum hirsutum FP-91666 SS1]|uniref:uncharacterized protein n=1 Tax=Stereum hirsutum (strain FP-91666) TaxID=721885 RepID=UPI000440A3EC|nr:uncharacterized protein STEHIDRAFT_165625 [Stereum hirsutum FP-91666 SS1]EIM91279.1 hypothetical protein STEHIDRAFT_165625 [Stereum hirsutum FP-91666 SS1]